jgi:hypothetical protein
LRKANNQSRVIVGIPAYNKGGSIGQVVLNASKFIDEVIVKPADVLVTLDRGQAVT